MSVLYRGADGVDLDQGFPVAEYTSPYMTWSPFARNIAPDGNEDTVIPRLLRAFFEVLATLVQKTLGLRQRNLKQPGRYDFRVTWLVIL